VKKSQEKDMQWKIWTIWTVLVAAGLGLASGAQAERKTENVILITLDGLRWQEVFGGLDDSLNNKGQGVDDPKALKEEYALDGAEARRETLMPFFWDVLAKEGQVFGDPARKSSVTVTNTRKFSYPGYNEILTGAPDRRVSSNAKKYNENVTVLEWLNNKPTYQGRVAVFGSWDVFPYIINDTRSGIPVNAGWMDLDVVRDPEAKERINRLQRDTPHYWAGVRFDLYTHIGALEYLKVKKPRVLYVAYGETDDWAHDRKYDMYIESAHRSDAFIREMWDTVQGMPEYAGKTSLVVAADHGRGDTAKDWTEHNAKIESAALIWIAVMGPDTPAAGAVKRKQVTQGQVAATVAALLGEDFNAENPKAAPPLPGVLGN
jgi:Metalloenzyme superfamily